VLENTRVCYIGPNITGIITVFLMSVQKNGQIRGWPAPFLVTDEI
jgi:hypothetical protein